MQRQWSQDDLIDHFTLLPHEQALLTPLRAAHTRLGFAILLKSFQLDGRFPAYATDIPFAVVHFVAQQLELDVAVFAHYAWRGRSSEEHRAHIREMHGMREATVADGEAFVAWLTAQLLTTHDLDAQRLKLAAYAHYRAQQIEPPTSAQLDRLIRTVSAQYETQWCAFIAAQLAPNTVTALDALLSTNAPELPADQVGDGGIRTLLHWLKADPGPLRVETADDEVAKLQHLRALQLPPLLFATLPRRVLERLRQRVIAEDAAELRRHSAPLRATLLAAFSVLREQEVTDTLVDLLIKMIHMIGVRADQRVEKELKHDPTQFTNKHGILRQFAEAAVAHPDGSIREVLFPILGEEPLRALVAELRATSYAYQRKVQLTMRRSYSHYYRRMVPPLLATLQFHSNNAVYQPLIDALALVVRYAVSEETHFDASETVPLDGVVPGAWRDLVVERVRGVKRVHRMSYELCVFQALRDKVRCKEVWVVGAYRYRNPDEDLPSDFGTTRTEYYATLELPLDATPFITQLQQELTTALQTFNDGLPHNTKVQIVTKRGGEIKLSPLTKQPEPPQLAALKAEVGDRWLMTGLLDMCKEADLRIGFTEHFKSLTVREHLDRTTLQRRLLLCLYGLGTNTGIKRMSSGNPSETYKDLLYVRRRFISRDQLRNAITAVVNATFQERQTDIWGEASSTCASDSKKFSAWEQNLITEWHTRYGGRGVVIYWHVEKKSACIYSQLKSCSSSEVAAAITGVIRHCTAMAVDKHYVDSHGQSEVAFGFCHLLGYKLCPRLKPMRTQRLYVSTPEQMTQFPHLTPVLKRAIDWDIIRQQYDELVKYATAIRLGTAEAEAILSRFTRNTSHPTYRALAELGRVIKTIFLCQYLHDETMRQEVQVGLNVVENWNSAVNFVFYGRLGELASNKREDQETAMLALHLLQSCLIYINTLMIQEVLNDAAWRTRLTPRDYQALTPLIYSHVNPYGTFILDMNTRLPLSGAVPRTVSAA